MEKLSHGIKSMHHTVSLLHRTKPWTLSGGRPGKMWNVILSWAGRQQPLMGSKSNHHLDPNPRKAAEPLTLPVCRVTTHPVFWTRRPRDGKGAISAWALSRCTVGVSGSPTQQAENRSPDNNRTWIRGWSLHRIPNHGSLEDPKKQQNHFLGIKQAKCWKSHLQR